MGDAKLEQRLFDEIVKIPILDSHSHINPLAPAARSFDEILSYHYYTELAHSAGMGKAVLEPGVPPMERVTAIAEFLPQLANTVQHDWLIEIARTFFGYSGDSIGPNSIREVVRLADERTAEAGWPETVLNLSKVEKIFLTNEFDDPLESFDTSRYVPCLRTDDLVFRLVDDSTRDRLVRASGMDLSSGRSFAAAIGRLFQRFVDRGAKACAISLPPHFEPVPCRAEEIETSWQAMLRSAASADEIAALQHFAFWTIASYCAEFRLPFDLMIGVNRRVYRAGVFQGQDLFDQRTSLYQYRELFNAFPQVTFPVSVLTSNQNQELVSYSWIFPNVVPHGHWWYSNVPAYIERDARARLTAVPASKQAGYYSDAYKLEFILPKFNMYRRVLSGILADDFVRSRGWSEDRAIALARQLLRDNIQRIFGV